MCQEGVLNVTSVNHNEILKMQRFLGICFTKMTLKMSKNYWLNLKNKPLSARAWQQYVFKNSIVSM